MFRDLFHSFLGLSVSLTTLYLEESLEPPFSSQTVSLGIRSGLLVPSVGHKSLLSDRFHLGGPTSVRMFKQNGLGLKDGGMPGSRIRSELSHILTSG